jgi:nucleoid-associated protein YgaU
MPRSEGGSTTDQPITGQQTETERVMEQRRGERGGQDATSMPSMTSTRTYIVKSGDTLSGIAESEMGDAKRWPELYAANKEAVGKNPDLIHPGLELRIPV